jgi:hypothetical protein
MAPLCSISQSVERDLGRKLCTWFKVDPDMQINRPQGRPKGKTADQGDVISLSFAEDGVTFIGEITRDYCGHIAKTSLTSLDVFKLAELLGHLRQDKLDVDAEFLEAWLERVAPDWRDQINQAAVNGPAGTWPESCWEVLGVEKADPMEKVAEYFRHSMQTVESLPNGAALQRPIITAYKEIQKYHRTKKGA